MPFDSPMISRASRTFLPRHATLVLDNAAGTVIAVDRGCLWLTLERDRRDIVLTQGMRFEIDRRGRTVIVAEQDSRVRMVKPLTLVARAAARLRHLMFRHVRGSPSRLYRRAVPYS